MISQPHLVNSTLLDIQKSCNKITLMKTEINPHPVQIKILRILLFKNEAKFSQLNTGELTNDHFTFHINTLVESSLIEKNKNNKYQLTAKGKEFANRFDTEKLVIEKQPKISVLTVCIQKIKNKTYYLVQQRLKEPYFGFHGFISGKVRWGETPKETAARELKEETNLSAKLTLAGTEHKIDYSKEKKLLEDKYFLIFKATSPQGKLTKNFEGGKNIWLTKKEIFSLPQLFSDIRQIMKLIPTKKLFFSEKKYIETKY